MKQQEIFKNAVWTTMAAIHEKGVTPIEFGVREEQFFPVLRGHFRLSQVKKATLYVLGLGFFHCYINGKRVGDDLFLPLNTDYEIRPNFPTEELLSGHRIYVPQYDITSLLEEGENTIAIHFGGGWYTFEDAKFGTPKAIWRVFGETENGSFDFGSSENDKIKNSFIDGYHILFTEAHNYLNGSPAVFEKDFDDSGWENAVCAAQPDTDYQFCGCPADRVRETLPVKCIGKNENETIYDCGKNTSGYPVLKLHAAKGEQVRVLFSEELNPDGTLCTKFAHGQSAVFISDGEEREVRPLFTWFGFRYFTVTGNAEPLGVEVIHTDLKQASHFESDNELLNWIHDAYLNTQLTNVHAGIPSDCPHIERRGYTGDGQLTCHAVMNMLDAKAFYRKWIGDIADSQDQLSGHVQYTAPYTLCGGGPGGWGCAIVEVPYQYYMHYGEDDVLREVYPNMLRYFDYLEAHSYGKLITSDKEGQWCLGDWCPPTSVVLPAPFVNNYFYIKSLLRTIEIAGIIGKEADIPLFEERIRERKEAVTACYFNSWDGNFLGNLQGANAFAVDIGLGDERTYRNLAAYYKKLGRYDTGIFGTDIVTRVLFEHGDGQLAADLLLSEDAISFDGMRRAGATTLWEYWPHALHDRSHNHPMFGAVAAYLYDYLLGIRNKKGVAAYREIEIAPVLVDGVDRLQGWRMLPGGKVSVSYEKNGSSVSFDICIPEGQSAVFSYNNETYPLTAGENNFSF